MGADWQNLSNALGDLGGFELGTGSNVNQAQRLFRLAIGNDDQAQAAVRDAWQRADRAIGARQEAFLAKIAQARAEGKPITEAWLYQVGRLDQLRASVASQYAYLGVVTNRAVTNAQRGAAGPPVDAIQALLEAQFYRSFDGMTDAEIRAWAAGGGGKGPPVRLDYATTDVDRAVNSLVGMLSNGAPLRDLTFSNLSLEGANGVAQALVVGATRGDSIRDIAAAMRLERNLVLARAQTIARTEILRANRYASLSTMRTTTISTPSGPTQAVKGWKWSVAPGGANVCGVCLSLAGTVHPVTEDFESHPNCRCAPVPITASWADLGFPDVKDTPAQVPDADDLVRRMSPADLRRAYGATRADLLAQGYLKPSDMVRWVDRGRWGKQPALATLGALRPLASSRGWNDPRLLRKVPAPVRPTKVAPTAHVPGLDFGPGSLQKMLDDRYAQHTEYHRKWNDAHAEAMRLQAEHPAWRMNPDQFPDIRAAVQARDAIQADWRSWSNAAASALKDERNNLLAYLKANAHLIPPDQARVLLKQLDDLQATWAKVQKGRVPDVPNPALYFQKRNWDALVDAALGDVGQFRRLVSWNLPLRDRLTAPRVGDTLFPGSKQTISAGRLPKVQATWDEVFRLTEALEQHFGWNTAWTGRLGIGGTGSGAAGTFDWHGVLSLSTSVVGKYAYQDRLKVELHELFHSMSAGKGGHNAGQYVVSRGWEEGVVERCTQVWESRILTQAGMTTAKPGYNTYQKYTQPLERIRSALGMSEDDYYLGLLETHVNSRSAKVKEWAATRGVTLDGRDLAVLGM